jgi:hypothetical protein
MAAVHVEAYHDDVGQGVQRIPILCESNGCAGRRLDFAQYAADHRLRGGAIMRLQPLRG